MSLVSLCVCSTLRIFIHSRGLDSGGARLNRVWGFTEKCRQHPTTVSPPSSPPSPSIPGRNFLKLVKACGRGPKLTLASPGLQSTTPFNDCRECTMLCSNWYGWKKENLLFMELKAIESSSLWSYRKEQNLTRSLNVVRLRLACFKRVKFWD